MCGALAGRNVLRVVLSYAYVACMAFGLTVSLVACAVDLPASPQPRNVSQAEVAIKVTYYARATGVPAGVARQADETAAVVSTTPIPAQTPALAPVLPTVSGQVDVSTTASQVHPTPQPVPQPASQPTSQPTRVDNPAPGATGRIEGVRQEMLDQLNTARAQIGLPRLTPSPQLQQAAQLQAEWLGHKTKEELWAIGASAHIGADGTSYVDRIVATGYSAQRENLNEIYVTAVSPQDALTWWMNDPAGASTHRPQIVSKVYREVGIGVVRHSSGAGFVFIVNFGAP